MAYLRSNVPAGLEELLSYFDNTYVSGTCRAIRCPPSRREPSAPRIRIRRQRPLFPPETWNVLNATVSNTQRTNNETEAWNNAFARQIGHSHPSLYRLLDNLRKDTALVHIALEAEARGHPARKRVRRATRAAASAESVRCTQRWQ